MFTAREWFQSAECILPVEWHPFRSWGAQGESPFDSTAIGGRLLLTFDDLALAGAPPEEQPAIELLRGLAAAGLVDGLGTLSSDIPHLIPMDIERSVYRRSDADSVFEAPVSEDALLHLSTIYGGDPRRDESVALAQSVTRVEPHRALRRDVLVSLDPALLANRDHGSLRGMNVRTPRETTRLAGLHLRSVSDYTYRAWAQGRATTSRRNFYVELAQLRLAHYWRLHFASPEGAEVVAHRDTRMHLSWSVVSRVAQALQALDEVGVVYHDSSEGQDAAERAAYHFNYGLLLLSGAIDALLRLAQDLVGTANARPSLMNPGYLKRLEREGATSVVDYARRPEVQATLYLLSRLRNRIHERELQTRTAPDGGPGIVAPEPIAIPLWCAARQLAPFFDFGLSVRSWDRLIVGGIEDVEAARFEMTISLYPYLAGLTHAVGGVLGDLAELFGRIAETRGIVRLPTSDRWEGDDPTRRRKAVSLLG